VVPIHTVTPFQAKCPNQIPLSHLLLLHTSLRLSTSWLGRWGLLHGPLALLDSAGAGNGIGAEVGAVVAVGGGLDDAVVGPE